MTQATAHTSIFGGNSRGLVRTNLYIDKGVPTRPVCVSHSGALMGGSGQSQQVGRRVGNRQRRTSEEPGVPTPTEVRIFKIERDGVHKFFTKRASPTLTSWGSDNFRKIIVTVPLEPGIYRIEIENIKSLPEFSGIPIAVVLA